MAQTTLWRCRPLKLISRPWQPKDLLDDLQMYIDEEPDNYLNGRRTAMCMARDYLKAYFDALESGRFIELPCKVGDTVYYRTYAKNATVDMGIQPHKVIAYRLSMVAESISGYPDTTIPDYEFGRSAFLSREEAEKALEGKNDG